MKWSTKKMATVAVLCAMAMIVNQFIKFPIVPAVPFLQYDPKDILIVIGGFIFGPMVSFVMSGLCSVLEIFLRGGNILDVLMNMISTCSFVCPAAFIYQHIHTKKGATIGLFTGVISVTLAMTIWNYIVTPFYFQMPTEAVVAMLLPGIIPFNLIKASANAILTLLIYKPIVKLFRKKHWVDHTYQSPINSGSVIAIVFVAISSVIAVLIFKGVI